MAHELRKAFDHILGAKKHKVV